jgi:hypothetical protein
VSTTGGRAGGSARGGTGGGSSGQGGRGGGAGTVGKGGGSPQAGRGGANGQGGRDLGQGGEAEPGGAAGEAGETPPCTGSGGYTRHEGAHCDSTWSYAQGGEQIKVEGATTLEECQAACDARPDCTAVGDYFELRGGYGCGVSRDTCDHVITTWAKEDGGLEYEKVCPAAGACVMQFLGYDVRCNDAGTTGTRVPGATTRAECEEACLDDPGCVSVYDYTYMEDVIGCWLNVGPCERIVNSYESGTTYRKVCD